MAPDPTQFIWMVNQFDKLAKLRLIPSSTGRRVSDALVRVRSASAVRLVADPPIRRTADGMRVAFRFVAPQAPEEALTGLTTNGRSPSRCPDAAASTKLDTNVKILVLRDT